MTLIGISLGAGAESAFAWADTETYRGDVAVAHTMKLVANRQSLVVAVGAGDTIGNEFLAEEIRSAPPIERLAYYLPGRVAKFAEDALKEDSEWSFGIVGWSIGYGRMLAATLQSRDNFIWKYVASGWVRPYVREFASFSARSIRDVVPLAISQMAEVKKVVRGAGAGAVTVAHISRDGISVTPFSIRSGRQLASIPTNLLEARI